MEEINKICTIAGKCYKSVNEFIQSKTGLQLEELGHLGIQFGTGAQGGGFGILYQRKQLFKDVKNFKTILSKFDRTIINLNKIQGKTINLCNIEEYHDISKQMKEELNSWKLDNKSYLDPAMGQYWSYQDPMWYRNQLAFMSNYIQNTMINLQLDLQTYYNTLSDLKNNLIIALQSNDLKSAEKYENMIEDLLASCI